MKIYSQKQKIQNLLSKSDQIGTETTPAPQTMPIKT